MNNQTMGISPLQECELNSLFPDEGPLAVSYMTEGGEADEENAPAAVEEDDERVASEYGQINSERVSKGGTPNSENESGALNVSPNPDFVVVENGCQEEDEKEEEEEEEEETSETPVQSPTTSANIADDAPTRMRRSSSLKAPREFATGEKKIVRFADALGLDLADVRTFLDELPSVPKSAYDDLRQMPSSSSASTPSIIAKCLLPAFQQPGLRLDFFDGVRDKNVALEMATVSEYYVNSYSILGTVRVKNIDFHKSVYVRYTLDGWKTFAETPATYVRDSCDGFSDKFAFSIHVYEINIGQKVELAVRYHCSGCQFWDNNNGRNYVFECKALTESTNFTDNQSSSFLYY